MENQNVTEPNQTQTPNPEVVKQPEGIPSSITPTPPVEDIATRASAVSLDEADPPKAESDILNGTGFDRNQWNAMLERLPADQRTQLEGAYKSLQTGADKKFQKAADMLRQAENSSGQPWTLDRVQQLTQDPEFVQAAQQYSQLTSNNQNPQDSGISNDEWTNLSEDERAKFHTLTKNQQALQGQLNNIMLNQEDDKLLSRYKNYDANAVKSLRTGLLNGSIQATSEHLWMVHDYHDAIKRAYKLGTQDRQIDLQEKQNASTVGVGGMQITPSGDKPQKQKGESIQQFFGRIHAYNKAAFDRAKQQ